jgi:capsular polysaccharide biosynthesis protein
LQRRDGARYVTPARTEPESETSPWPGDEYVVSLGDLLRGLRRWWWAVALAALVCVGAAVGWSLTQDPTYEASIRILVGQEESENAPINLGSDVQGLQQLTQTMVEAVKSRPVAEGVIEELGLRATPEALLGNVSVEQIPNTQFIELSYRDPDPRSAERIANAFGEIFSEQISEVSPSANAITATVWEQAVVPEEPVSPDPVRDGLLALMVGLLLGIGLAFLLEYLDDSWQSPEEAERVSGVPTFGVVPRFKAPRGKAKG